MLSTVKLHQVGEQPNYGCSDGFILSIFTIILQIYNSSLIIENVDVDWTNGIVILINNLVGLIKILLNYKT
jgi:hypothetical protein